MSKKLLTVPQSGTQPAVTPSPLDSMVSGQPVLTPASVKLSTKKPTSFNLNPIIFNKFKAECARNGRVMSSVIEELMEHYISDKNDL